MIDAGGFLFWLTNVELANLGVGDGNLILSVTVALFDRNSRIYSQYALKAQQIFL